MEKDNLADLFTGYGNVWRDTQQQLFLSLYDDDSYETVHPLSRERLDASDPRLHRLLHVMLDARENHPDGQFITADRIDSTLKYWATPFALKDQHGNPHRACELYAIEWQTHWGIVRLHAEFVTVKTAWVNAADPDHPVVYVDNTRTDMLLTRPQSLDTLFSGWRDRYYAAIALGLQGTARANYVCPHPATVRSVPDVTPTMGVIAFE